MPRIHRSLAAVASPTAGVVEAVLNVPSGVELFIERVRVFTNSTSPTSLAMYVGDVTPANERTYTPEGDDNELECNPNIWAPPGSVVRFVWEGGTAPGGTELAAVANLQGRLAAPEV